MRAVANIQRSYPELMSTLDEADWANKTSSFCRLNVPEEHARAVTTDVFAAEGWIETSLLHLLDTGVIVPVVTTAESTADMKEAPKVGGFSRTDARGGSRRRTRYGCSRTKRTNRRTVGRTDHHRLADAVHKRHQVEVLYGFGLPRTVRPIDERRTVGAMIRRGLIEMYRPEKLFGFIRPNDGGNERHIFFHWSDVQEDELGRRCAQVGVPVEFDVQSAPNRGHARATFVRPLWNDAEDIASYREESVITRWLKNSGIARRPDGGTVAVSLADVVTEGEEVLGIGCHILHGVRPPEMGQRFWTATDVEIFLPQQNSAPVEVWPPVGTPPIERNVIVFPAPSPLLSERLKNKRLRDIKIRKAS